MAEPAGVQVHLRSVGEASALKKSKFRIDGGKSIYEVEKFLRKQLKHEGSIFLFCGSGFSPTPDQILKDLFDVRACGRILRLVLLC
jgi:hypothetical protein